MISTSDAMKSLTQTISLEVAIKKKTKAKIADERIKIVQIVSEEKEDTVNEVPAVNID